MSSDFKGAHPNGEREKGETFVIELYKSMLPTHQNAENEFTHHPAKESQNNFEHSKRSSCTNEIFFVHF